MTDKLKEQLDMKEKQIKFLKKKCRDAGNLINELKDNDSIKPEVFFNKETRFDFLIEKNKQKIFVEVKNAY